MLPNSVKVTDYKGDILAEEAIKERIQELKRLVLDDEKLKNVRTDDEYLLRYLHCCNFNVEEAFERMKGFHELVEDNSDWFTFSSPAERTKQIKSRAKVMLQCRDKEGRSVYLFRVGNIDTSSSDIKKEAQLDELWFETVLDNFETQAKGITILADIRGYSWKLMKWITPTNLKLAVQTTKLFPCKEFTYHFVNGSFLLKASLNMAWPFLPEDLRRRIIVHNGDWSSLHEHISPEVLPPEYGGSAPEVNYEKLEQWFLDQDEKIRKCLEYRQKGLHKSSA